MKWQDLSKIGKGPLVMNEQIKELADTAHKQAYEIYTERLTREKADKVIFYDIFNQKFAELIVRECVLISRTSTDGFTAGRRM